jgi:hypothetical protein
LAEARTTGYVQLLLCRNARAGARVRDTKKERGTFFLSCMWCVRACMTVMVRVCVCVCVCVCVGGGGG